MIPIGGIIQWSGSIASIPSNFALCDGNNGTPDLTDRFIMGAGGSRAPGVTGGSEIHSHTISVDVSVAGTGPEQAWPAAAPSDDASSLSPFYALANIMRLT